MIVGNGDYRYRVNADWARLPDGWSFKEVGGVGSTATTMSMSLTAATTQCWCSIVTATFCAPGVKTNTRGRTACS